MFIHECLPGIMVVTPSQRVGQVERRVKSKGCSVDRVEVRYLDREGGLVDIQPALLKRYTDTLPKRPL